MRKPIAIAVAAMLGAGPAAAASGPFFSLRNTDFIVLIAFLCFVGVLVWFKVPALLRAARSWPEPAARAARAALAGADRRIKLSVEPEAALLAAVVASLRPSGRPAR